MENRFCISSDDVLKIAAKNSTKSEKDFQVDPYVIIYFPNMLLEYLKGEANMIKDDWLLPFHPYSSGFLFRGNYEGIPISAIQPPMGASPISCVVEDLINCGARVILLVCGSWGIGKDTKLLDYIIPTHTTGPDGISSYYGRNLNDELIINSEIITFIIQETKKNTKHYHIGKNFSHEALYRMRKSQILKLQKHGFISMENGELNVIATICRIKRIKFGAIFYSYFNPLEEWSIPWLKDNYRECVELEGKIVLATIKKINLKLNDKNK